MVWKGHRQQSAVGSLAQEELGDEPELRHAFFSSGRDNDATRRENGADSVSSACFVKLNFVESRVLSSGQTEALTAP
jgi:hypothetical protein